MKQGQDRTGTAGPARGGRKAAGTYPKKQHTCVFFAKKTWHRTDKEHVFQIMPLFVPPAVFSPPPFDRTAAQIHHIAAQDVQWNKPVFRPPSLPTPAQIWSELPFTARYVLKHGGQK